MPSMPCPSVIRTNSHSSVHRPSIQLSTCASTGLSICLSIHLFTQLSNHPSINQSVCLPVNPSTYPCICPFIHLYFLNMVAKVSQVFIFPAEFQDLPRPVKFWCLESPGSLSVSSPRNYSPSLSPRLNGPTGVSPSLYYSYISYLRCSCAWCVSTLGPNIQFSENKYKQYSLPSTVLSSVTCSNPQVSHTKRKWISSFIFFHFELTLHNHNHIACTGTDDATEAEWVATRRLLVKEIPSTMRPRKKKRLCAHGRAHQDTCFLYAVN